MSPLITNYCSSLYTEDNIQNADLNTRLYPGFMNVFLSIGLDKLKKPSTVHRSVYISETFLQNWDKTLKIIS